MPYYHPITVIQAFQPAPSYAANKKDVPSDAGNFNAKLAYAEKLLAEHKIKLDFDTLKAMIDAEIKKMEQQKTVVAEYKIE